MPSEPAAAPAAGWYRDPHGAGLRWWDGSAWTEHVHAEVPPPVPPSGESPDPDALLAMYSVRHEAGASDDPSYAGYKAMLVLLALAILAILVGLLLVGGSGDDGGALGADLGAVTASVAEAEALLRA